MRQKRLKCARAGARSDEAEGQAEDAAVADTGMRGRGARMPFRPVQQEVPSCNLLSVIVVQTARSVKDGEGQTGLPAQKT